MLYSAAAHSHTPGGPVQGSTSGRKVEALCATVERDHFRQVGAGCDLKGTAFGFQRQAPTFDCGAAIHSVAKESTKETDSVGFRAGNAGKSSNCKMPGDRTSFLLTSVCSEEEKQRLETGNRSKHLKSVPVSSTFQDGNCPFYKVPVKAGRVCSSFRPKGCLFPHPNSGKVPKVSKVLHSWCGLQVRGSLFRAVYGSKSFHYGDESCGEAPKTVRNASSCLSGRLAPEKSLSKHVVRSARQIAPTSRKVGNSSKFRQISTVTKTGICVPRGKVRLSQGIGISDRGSHEEASGLASVFPGKQDSSGKSVSFFSRPIEPYIRHGSIGKVAHAAHSVVPEVLLHSKHRSSLQGDPVEGKFLRVPPVLGRSEGLTSRGSFTPSIGTGIDFLRCQSNRLGSTVRRSFSGRAMERPTGRSAFQCERADGHDQRSREFRRKSKKQGSDASFGQPHISFSCAETRGHSLVASVLQDSHFVPLGGEAEHQSQIQMDAGEGFDRSGFPEQNESNHAGGMVSTGCSVQETACILSRDQSRPICDIRKQEASKLCESMSRREGTGSGRLFSMLGRDESVCLSTSQTVNSGSQEIADGPEFCSVDSSSLARPILVSNDSESAGRFSEETTHPQEIIVTESGEGVLYENRGTKSSRLAFIKRSMQEKGFSEKVSERASLCNRESTRSIYDSRFSRFVKWCDDRQRSVEDLTIQEIADFFMYLFDKGNSVSTIAGYRSAITSAVRSFEVFLWDLIQLFPSYFLDSR